MSRIIALLTDFGTTDAYVGVMKGAMLAIAPGVQLVDLTHAIQPQNVKQAAFVLLNSYGYFPPGTIFLVVVDPGVGSSRKPIAVRAGGYIFVAPDNGVLSYVIRDVHQAMTVELDNPDYRLDDTSNTFHGRDIFAPAAAHVAACVPLEAMGGSIDDAVTLSEPTLTIDEGQITGEVLCVDHFGTVVTSMGLLNWSSVNQLTLMPRFGASSPLSFAADTAIVKIGNQQIFDICRTYAEVAPGEALALVGSSGYLELSINQGNFAALTDVKVGDPVVMQIG